MNCSRKKILLLLVLSRQSKVLPLHTSCSGQHGRVGFINPSQFLYACGSLTQSISHLLSCLYCTRPAIPFTRRRGDHLLGQGGLVHRSIERPITGHRFAINRGFMTESATLVQCGLGISRVFQRLIFLDIEILL